MIQVIFPNGKQGEVPAEKLQALIDDRKITSFRRTTGWAVLGRDRFRETQRRVFCIPERRETDSTAFV